MRTVSAGLDEVLTAVRDLPGVLGAAIEPAAVVGPEQAGVPDPATPLLRLDLGHDVDEVVIAAAVDDLLRARFGVGTDPAAVRLVETVAGEGGADDHLTLRALTLVRVGDQVTVDALLGWDGHEGPGRASAEDTPEGTVRAVIEALLLAVEEVTEDAVIGTVEHVDAAAETVALRLRLDVDGREVEAHGSAALLGSVPQAVTRAVLDAVAPHLPEVDG